MTDESKLCLEEAKEHMQGAVNHFEKELHKIRAGKASPQMLEGLKVDYYGTMTPLGQVANISVPDPRQIIVQPWEKNMLSVIDKAIQAANLGFNPQNNVDSLRIMVPPLTEDRRKELVKTARAEAEAAKVHIRNVRRNANEEAKKLEKANNIPEDEIKQLEKEIQDATNKYIDTVDKVLADKEKEIMTV